MISLPFKKGIYPLIFRLRRAGGGDLGWRLKSMFMNSENSPSGDLRGDPENWWRIAQDSGHNFHFFWDDGFSHGKRAGNALKTCALESTEVVATKNAQTFCPTPSELREPAL